MEDLLLLRVSEVSQQQKRVTMMGMAMCSIDDRNDNVQHHMIRTVTLKMAITGLRCHVALADDVEHCLNDLQSFSKKDFALQSLKDLLNRLDPLPTVIKYRMHLR